MSSVHVSTPTRAGESRLPLQPLLILGLGVLVTVTAESLPAGMMPEMAADLAVKPLEIGLLISVWAITVIVTSVPLARATGRVDRRLVVGYSLTLFALANIATALASSYPLAMATRVLAATAHGVFWAVVIVYASSLLSPSQLGRGLAVVTAGGTAATVAGLPAATLIAQTWGWRTTFVILGAIALLIGAVVVRRMPSYRPDRAADQGRDRGFWRDPSLPALALLGAAATLIAVAQFASFTYIRPYLEISAAIAPAHSSGLLFLYGAAGMVGVVTAGFLADRFPRGSLAAVLVLFVLAFLVLTVASTATAAVVSALATWGFAIGALFPLLQTTLMKVASERTRTLASAGLVVLFNVGIAIGPWLGGIVGGAAAPTTNTAASAGVMLVAAVLGVLGLHRATRWLRPAAATTSTSPSEAA
ncbi:MFS transporter [Pseudactinotalea suaedae]|uniref:MFS transporter n=1 Tax=Pseudactinotalea suaedae TaxID=1524924 RepID=UPI00139098C3|nr:MFS transporter [Pseudactinotalea suaedae]